MDLETENRLATLLLEEARRMRSEAEKEGVHAYLQQRNVRHRPNSRFLTATVLGAQQANRVVEVNEMWRAREKELELESKMRNRSKDRTESRGEKRRSDSRNRSTSSSTEQEDRYYAPSSSMSKACSYRDEERGLRDEELEEFLHSRVKRGRGAIGSRMDEPGPYLTAPSNGHENLSSHDARVEEERERRVQGPEKPLFLKSRSPDDSRSTKSSTDEAYAFERRHRKEKKSLEKRKSKEKKRSKHRHHHHKSRRRE